MTDQNAIVVHMISRGVVWGAVLGTVSGIVLGFPVLIIGAVCGSIVGSFVGILVGMATGAIAATVTVVRFYPLKNPMSYRAVMAAVCGICAAFFTHIGSFYFSAGSLGIVPPAMAAVLALPISQLLASWYIKREITRQA